MATNDFELSFSVNFEQQNATYPAKKQSKKRLTVKTNGPLADSGLCQKKSSSQEQSREEVKTRTANIEKKIEKQKLATRLTGSLEDGEAQKAKQAELIWLEPEQDDELGRRTHAVRSPNFPTDDKAFEPSYCIVDQDEIKQESDQPEQRSQQRSIRLEELTSKQEITSGIVDGI